MEGRSNRFALTFGGAALLALAGCGGTISPTPSPTPIPIQFKVWVMPSTIWIAQGSSETVAVGACTPAPCVGIAGTQGSVEDVSVQIGGLPQGVTASPSSFTVKTDEAPQALTFFVNGSATPGSVTVTLTGASGAVTGGASVPIILAPANPLTPTPTCPSSTPSPPPNPSPTPNEWTWESGSNTLDQPGVYGTEGMPSPSNVPGARAYPASWTDSSGDFWLFGGYGAGAAAQDDLNDLWKYSGSEWTWVGGSNVPEQPGVYGSRGVPSPANVPGARYNAASWTDAAGNFWLFGGLGVDSNGTRGDLNDLWKYDPATNLWTWMGGPAKLCSTQSNYLCPSVYGTQGIPAQDNAPGSRTGASTWTDSCGNLWLFGGEGNDLWKYDSETNLWAWMSGANIAVGQNGTYGTLGVPDPGNVPGARVGAAAWTDKAGNLWLFGGEGEDVNGILCEENGKPCDLNDLWKYDPTVNTWTWVSGSDVSQQPGIYGTESTAAPGNVPGGRDSAVTWTDAQGNFWLFGGAGYDSRTNYGDLNDLWKYDPSTGEWTWMSGSDTVEQLGIYGTLGTPAPGNVPGARIWAVGRVDQTGNLWLFGGFHMFALPSGKFNDLWKYQP